MVDVRSGNDNSLVKASFIKCFSSCFEEDNSLLVSQVECLSHGSTDDGLHADLG